MFKKLRQKKAEKQLAKALGQQGIAKITPATMAVEAHSASDTPSFDKMRDRNAYVETFVAQNVARKPFIVGFVFVIACFVITPLAAHFMKIQGAVVASGQLKTVETKAFIQHEIGGVIKEVFVKPGTTVNQGDILLVLDSTSDEADLRDYRIQLQAERDNLERLNLLISTAPDDWEKIDANSLSNELVAASLASIKNASDKDLAEIKALESKIESLKASEKAVVRQIDNLQKQLKKQRDLYARKLVNISGVEEADLRAANSEVELEHLRRQILDAALRKETLESNINQREIDFRQKLLEEKIAAGDVVQRLEQAIIKTNYVLDRKTIIAPVNGVLTNLIDLTPGTLISPSNMIAALIPESSSVTADLLVLDQDIEHIQAGQPATVQLGVTSELADMRFEGVVEVVSVDRVADADLNNFYQVIVRMEADQFEDLNLPNGVAVTGYLAAEPETLLSNVLSPITDMFSKVYRQKG